MTKILHSNGVDGLSGEYLVTGVACDTLLAGLSPAANLDEFRLVLDAHKATLGVKLGYNALDVANVGWGLVLPEARDAQERRANDDVICALAPLLERRGKQAGARFRILDVKQGESRETFLARHGQAPGPINPNHVPYYYLIVADPEVIGFEFQCSLDVPAAVGRIWFDDPQAPPRADYLVTQLRSYAERVVAAETAWRGTREAAFIGMDNDEWTRQSASELVAPLHARFTTAGWTKQRLLGAEATRTDVLARLGGARPSGMVFIATHGVAYPAADERQRERQGALLCQEWPGRPRIPDPDQQIAGADLDGADLRDAVCLLFGCFSLGTPRSSEFQHVEPRMSTRLARRAFVARLAQRLVEQGALAVLGHVERAWGWSYSYKGMSALDHFETALDFIARGAPVGGALEDFGQRTAEYAVLLAREIEQRDDKIADPEYIATLFTIVNDARGWTVFGDPAARIGASAGPP